MFTRLTRTQYGLISNLLRPGVTVWFHGLDAEGLPVVSFKDARRKTERFCIYRLGLARATGKPHYPLRDLTEAEQDLIEPSHHELLSRCVRDIAKEGE